VLQTQKEAREALADAIEKRTDISINDSLIWLAEPMLKDKSRPDLMACAGAEEGPPVVMIEAKLGAAINPDQLRSYEKNLRLRSSKETALLVLVPKGRIAEATHVAADALDLPGSGPWRVTDRRAPGVAIISWDELFDVLWSSKEERCRHVVVQLQSMYRELSSDFIATLASDEDLHQWRSSETNFAKLVDQVTRQLTQQHKTYPWQTETLEETGSDGEPLQHHFRYICPFAGDKKSCYSIGVRDSFAKWITPIWMRFHKDTSKFRLIRERIRTSDLRKLESSGHIWMPLDIPRDVSGDQMVQSLVDQAQEVVRVAYPAE
jgi:hypothetical protein